RTSLLDDFREAELCCGSRRGLQLAQRLLIANHARIAGIEVFADSRRRAEGRAFFQGCRRYFHSGDEIAVDPFYFLAGIMVWIDEIDNVGEHDLARKIAALEQQARRDPGTPLPPTGNGGRI